MESSNYGKDFQKIFRDNLKNCLDIFGQPGQVRISANLVDYKYNFVISERNGRVLIVHPADFHFSQPLTLIELKLGSVIFLSLPPRIIA